MLETLKEWDFQLFIYLNSLGIESWDGFWLLITKTTFWIPLFLSLLFLIYKSYGYKRGILIVIYFLGAIFFSIVLMLSTKYFVARLRPSSMPELAEIIRALQKPVSYSFYSGHASSSFMIATFAVLVLRKYYRWIYVLFLFPFLFSLSRIFVGVHFPSDLLVGAMIGTLLAILFYKRCKLSLERTSVKKD
ncbi:MAG: phosphatase PAP2 family protein [Flavobacteriaceae bacterium CG_4_8_14_3_um_filter_34_10]|nr:phosphatase PAP2 family protein [Flavobacteriia bacterium]OIP49680.1 MAG: phosphatase PAP2 family protein [Flavobacteriaceae bacterium CG2_30_34_30]PIQ18758.1 MAG: phosphatase PAP2 family protein [Flavobacteriaceae bacterium CG18_big_fil_WC_8_21_14_2_50_34_36]PIV50899.1 MAG: phosphatase PAP2 family protein [Flavobacteriaceae bacterium CG02_land_8_20_14_3_00_34_13]PIX08632.1 MAG: phosphatase PAP2 family protein [Flavobacteriaceae bacterium CG_4_8_14_3_um_filter_34_10]PIZ09152.1 MAG: phosphat